ncbi:MAG: alpha/beta hydrolase [Puniceicoccaceae bacterium]
MRFCPVILFLAGSLLLAGCSSPLTTGKAYLYQEVFHVTTRNDTGLTRPDKRFGGERGSTRFGVSMLAVDPDKTFSAFAAAQPNHSLQQEALLESQPVQQIVDLEQESFFEQLSAYSSPDNPHPPFLIYIHGYKKSFKRAAVISAQLRYELGFPGPVITFSWPSTNAVSGYAADLENLNWSRPVLQQLIVGLQENYPESPIHIIAHSMGNKALLETLDDLQQVALSTGEWSIGEIILVAPDIDQEIFIRDVASRLATMPSRKTLYVSSKDFPLFASATVYQYPRLGDSRNGVTVVEGVETIDVSDAIPLFEGHGYYEANKETIEDLYYLINKGLGAEERPLLEAVETEEGKYWRLPTAKRGFLTSVIAER